MHLVHPEYWLLLHNGRLNELAEEARRRAEMDAIPGRTRSRKNRQTRSPAPAPHAARPPAEAPGAVVSGAGAAALTCCADGVRN